MTRESAIDVTAPGASRRSVLAGAGAAAAVVVLGGCAAYDSSSGGNPPPEEPGSGGGDPAAAEPFAQTSDIPVGSAAIFADKRVVVSQPQEGTFKAFTAVCTHQGCIVSDVNGPTIVCNCHGSSFNAADGSVAGGPAGRPLREVAITVDGTGIKLA